MALLLCAVLVTGCFGYNSSAKKWSYAGDTILVLAGAGAITADIVTKDEPCMGTGCSGFDPPFGGAMVAGVLLVTAGIVGYAINATRPIQKSSH